MDVAAGGGRLAGEVASRGVGARAGSAPQAGTLAVPSETRALVALGYPFWPLAVLALFDPKRDRYVKRQAWQALGFNFGMYAIWFMLHAIAAIPVLGISAWPLLPLIIPVAFVGALRQRRYGNVSVHAAAIVGALSAAGVVGGVALANALPQRALRVLFAAVMVFLALQFLRRYVRGRRDRMATDE